MEKNFLQQHDLNQKIAHSFIKTVEVNKKDKILEIGPGKGALTSAMLDAGAKVFAVEYDRNRSNFLREKFKKEIETEQLELLTGDALVLLPELPKNYRIISNPPFQITAKIMEKFTLLEEIKPKRIDLVLQYQTAQKLCGEEDEHNISSIMSHAYGIPKISKKIKRDDVTPPSRVDLSGFSLIRHKEPLGFDELTRLKKLLTIVFSGHQTTFKALRKIATPQIIKKQAKRNKWSPDAHPKTLSPKAWIELSSFLSDLGKI